MATAPKFSPQEAKALLWQRGSLSYLLRPHQVSLYNAVKECQSLKFVINCARRYGKTFTLLVYATEMALNKPGAMIRFAAPTEKQLKKIIRPNLRVILADCPEKLKPKFRLSESVYLFPNGSELHISGSERENCEKLRGTGADFAIVDEAGSISNLDYLVNDILLPQTLDNHGRLVVCSTPPPTPAHPFITMLRKAESDGAYCKRTIMENTFLGPDMIEKYKEASGGEHSMTWRREYMCEIVVDEALAVIPECDEAKMAEIVAEPEIPPYFQPLVSMDVGWDDYTAVLFGYYDFLKAKLVVQDEFFLNRMTTDDLAYKIRSTEAKLWKDHRPLPLRWCDTDKRLIWDMAQIHNLHFVPTPRDEKEAQINQLRLWVKGGKLQISPRCVGLIRQLRTAIWNRARTLFERVPGEGHFDSIDALVYMVRNAPVFANPYPAIPHGVANGTHWIRAGYDQFGKRNDNAVFSKIFRR